jgi:hypothetical protein
MSKNWIEQFVDQIEACTVLDCKNPKRIEGIRHMRWILDHAILPPKTRRKIKALIDTKAREIKRNAKR